MKTNAIFRVVLTISLFTTAPFLCAQQKPAAPDPAAALKALQSVLATKPSQPDVEVDQVTPEETAKCKAVAFREGGYSGQMILGPDGTTPLRVLCRRDTPAAAKEEKAEQLRFYRNGIEVFRDDFVTGECRWLGDAGTRRGIRSGGQIERWTVLSPEEATAEAVAALIGADEARYRRVALTEEDLAALKMTGPVADELTKQIKSVADFKALSERLAIPQGVKWGAFNGNHPAMMPLGRNALAVDLPVYFNATVVLMNPDDPSQSHQLYIGDMVKIGEVWKIVGLPAGEPFGQPSDKVMITSTLFPAAGGAAADAQEGKAVNEWGTQLSQAFEALEKAAPDQAAAECEKIFNLYMTLGENIPAEQSNFIRQAADFLMNESQTGRYPAGNEKLAQLYDLLAKQNAGRDLIAVVRLRQLAADYYKTGADQKLSAREKYDAEEQYREKLAAFADEYARTAAAAEALMLLAQDKEYVQENDAAINYYTTIADDFPETLAGRRAAGALKRLSSEGRPYQLPENWRYSDGTQIEMPAGKKTAIFGWAAWMNPADFEQMKKIAADNPYLTIIGVALDGSAEVVQSALEKIGATPWKNVFIPTEEGSAETAESPAAIELGAQSAPLILLLDEQGNMLVPNISMVDDLKNRLAAPVPKE